MYVDVRIQIGLGRFFGAKFRAGVLYGVFERSGERAALAESINVYRRARGAWAELAGVARGVYQSDVTVGELPQLRGHWLDRLPAMDEDIAALEEKLEQPGGQPAPEPHLKGCLEEILGRPSRPGVAVHHNPPLLFRPGRPMDLELALPNSSASVRLYYRHVNQGERFQTASMQGEGNRFRATIPAAYTDSPYPLQYYFEIQQDPRRAALFPEFGPELTQQPYFVVRQA